MKKIFPGIYFAIICIPLFQSCKKDVLPVVTTSPVTTVSVNSALCGGNVTSEGSDQVTARGICWSLNNLPSLADGKTLEGGGAGTFSSTISGLDAAKVYFVRAYATNSTGTAYGEVLSFTTLGDPPLASTSEASLISASSATLNGSVTANYLSTTVTFEYGQTTAYGNSIGASQSPVSGNAPVSLSAALAGLNAGATYHYRIKAVNSLGTAYGDDMSFQTPLMDMDGNVYNAITIGTQVWMQENLRTTKLNDGSPIVNRSSANDWSMVTNPAYCWYENNDGYKSSYGALYNHYAVNTGRLCPAGWHVPSKSEWTVLTDFLGGVAVAGGKMKEAGTTHWNATNQDATNESLFTALPGGYRSYSDGAFFSIRDNASWWTSGFNTSSTAWIVAITLYNTSDVQVVSGNLRYGVSVRCLKDE